MSKRIQLLPINQVEKYDAIFDCVTSALRRHFLIDQFDLDTYIDAQRVQATFSQPEQRAVYLETVANQFLDKFAQKDVIIKGLLAAQLDGSKFSFNLDFANVIDAATILVITAKQITTEIELLNYVRTTYAQLTQNYKLNIVGLLLVDVSPSSQSQQISAALKSLVPLVVCVGVGHSLSDALVGATEVNNLKYVIKPIVNIEIHKVVCCVDFMPKEVSAHTMLIVNAQKTLLLTELINLIKQGLQNIVVHLINYQRPSAEIKQLVTLSKQNKLIIRAPGLDLVDALEDQKSMTVLNNADYFESKRTTPILFKYKLTSLAKQAQKTIVLPEGDETRTIKAASICNQKGIAKCILLGNVEKIKQIARAEKVDIANIQIIEPATIQEKHLAHFVELRKNKGLTVEQARQQIQDNVVLATLMLENGDVDGLVSGAVHTTADTIRPALQLIKTSAGSSLVSSIFFMLFPDKVYIYGDCAINPNPTAEQLAEIAIQSADSAKSFGIEPKVAMISYSTGASGIGKDVEKVANATAIVKAKRADLVVDGPLQYDAAVMADVAKSKAPNSPVAGQANVFIFPDLNTGNTVYKAVQRTANLLSIGPMLQGMRKPVNDLSRGALVEDIVYTVALTAIQAN